MLLSFYIDTSLDPIAMFLALDQCEKFVIGNIHERL